DGQGTSTREGERKPVDDFRVATMLFATIPTVRAKFREMAGRQLSNHTYDAAPGREGIQMVHAAAITHKPVSTGAKFQPDRIVTDFALQSGKPVQRDGTGGAVIGSRRNACAHGQQRDP